MLPTKRSIERKLKAATAQFRTGNDGLPSARRRVVARAQEALWYEPAMAV
jgi:hypothetical protein